MGGGTGAGGGRGRRGACEEAGACHLKDGDRQICAQPSEKGGKAAKRREQLYRHVTADIEGEADECE